MRFTKLISGLALISAMTAQQGCSNHSEEQHYGFLGDTSPQQSVRLLGKVIGERRATLFYDTDGDTNTTEVVCRANVGWLDVSAKVFDSKVGDSKPLEKWHADFSHKDYPAFWISVKEKAALSR